MSFLTFWDGWQDLNKLCKSDCINDNFLIFTVFRIYTWKYLEVKGHCVCTTRKIFLSLYIAIYRERIKQIW